MTRELEKLAYISPEQELPSNHGREKQALLDEGISPLLWGAGGGVGGYMAADQVLGPLIRLKEISVENNMKRGRIILERLQRLRKIAPLVGGIGGALLLASIMSDSSKKKQKERMDQYGNNNYYRQGINPSDIYDVNDPSARII